MKEIFPFIGEKTVKQRLDELFSREVLGSILLGTAVGKVVEKINTIAVIVLILIIFDVPLSDDVSLFAFFLLLLWFIEALLFIKLYIRWEKYMRNISDKAETVSEKY